MVGNNHRAGLPAEILIGATQRAESPSRRDPAAPWEHLEFCVLISAAAADRKVEHRTVWILNDDGATEPNGHNCPVRRRENERILSMGRGWIEEQ